MYPKIPLSAAVIGVLVLGMLMYGQLQYRKGYTAATEKISSDLAKAAQRQAQKAHAADTAYQRYKAQNAAAERTQYVKVEKIIEKPVYRNICFDDDGLRELNRAIAR